MGNLGSVEWPILWGFAVTWIVFGAVQLIPRAIRSVYTWTSTALFSSLTGSRRAVATIFAGACFMWVLVVAGAIYSPLTFWAPQVLPFPGGLVRFIIVIELWLLVIGIPLVLGAVEFYFSSGSIAHRLSMVPRAFVHVVGIALALAILLPWIVWRFATKLVQRKKEEQLRLDIDLDKYDSVTQALVAALQNAGLDATIVSLPIPVRFSRTLLQRLGPPMLRPKADYEAKRIVGEGYSLLVFDGLIDAVATRGLTSRVRVGLIGRMPPEGLWLTQSEPARELERLIRTEGAGLDDVPQRIAEVEASLEEWRVLSWEYTQVLAHRTNAQATATPQLERDAGGDGGEPTSKMSTDTE